MAIEIAIRTRTTGKGRHCSKQAIFISESELDGALSDVRTIIAKQDIEVPQDYRFLTRSGNVIPWAIEETLILREVTVTSCGSKANNNKNELQDDAVKLETSCSDDAHSNESGGSKDTHVSVPELWIVCNGDFIDFTCGDEANKGNEQRDTEETSRCKAIHAQLCPWKAFINFSKDGNATGNLFKLLFFLVVLLFMLLASLVLTTHVVFGLFSTVTTHPEFNSLFSRLKSDRSVSSEELSNLRLKVSELELSWKFNFDQLNTKVTELEDLYLNDLAKHKREMASLRNQNADISGNFASLKDLEVLQAKVDKMLEHSKAHQGSEEAKTQHGKKKEKKGKAREGL